MARNQEGTLGDVVGRSGLFTDGDWIESKDQDPAGDVRLIQLADIGVGQYLNRSARFLTSQKVKQLGCTLLQPGDLLIARMPDPLGRACIFPGDAKPCVTAVDVCVVRPDPHIAHTAWLKWILNSRQFHLKLARFTTGTTRQRISRTNLQKLPLRIPPVAEQRRVASILAKADAIRHKRQEAIRLADEFLRSAFLEMFGNPVTNPKAWPVATLGQLAPTKGAIVDGPFGSSLKPECYVPIGVRVVRNFNIKDDRFDDSAFKYVTRDKFEEISRSAVEVGDILISTKGTIGSVCIMPQCDGPSVLSASGTVRIRLPTGAAVTPEFVVSQMICAPYKRYLTSLEAGTNQKYLNLDAIRRLRLIVPPLEAQRQYTNLRAARRTTATRAALAHAAARELFDSLLQRAFRGQL